MSLPKLKNKILKGLEILAENDRDLQTLTVWCNPNFKYGADQDMRANILKILKDLKKEGIITAKKKKINVYDIHHSGKEFELWSLKKKQS